MDDHVINRSVEIMYLMNRERREQEAHEQQLKHRKEAHEHFEKQLQDILNALERIEQFLAASAPTATPRWYDLHPEDPANPLDGRRAPRAGLEVELQPTFSPGLDTRQPIRPADVPPPSDSYNDAAENYRKTSVIVAGNEEPDVPKSEGRRPYRSTSRKPRRFA